MATWERPAYAGEALIEAGSTPRAKLGLIKYVGRNNIVTVDLGRERLLAGLGVHTTVPWTKYPLLTTAYALSVVFTLLLRVVKPSGTPTR